MPKPGSPKKKDTPAAAGRGAARATRARSAVARIVFFMMALKQDGRPRVTLSAL
jgi:hypothetical protein